MASIDKASMIRELKNFEAWRKQIWYWRTHLDRFIEEYFKIKLKDIQQVDLTEEAIYVWMSETMIMPIPLHAFTGMDEMKEAYKLIRQKIKEAGGALADDDK